MIAKELASRQDDRKKRKNPPRIIGIYFQKARKGDIRNAHECKKNVYRKTFDPATSTIRYELHSALFTATVANLQ